jgi:hypothetical protein
MRIRRVFWVMASSHLVTLSIRHEGITECEMKDCMSLEL